MAGIEKVLDIVFWFIVAFVIMCVILDKENKDD